MALIISDPNDIIINGIKGDNIKDRFENFIPSNENLVPYVEFFAIRKSQITAYLDNANNITSVQNVYGNEVKSNSESLKIPLMGFDTKTNSYTTNWTRDITGSENRFSEEGFGITEIDVSVKASFIPTFRVKFVDTKGTSLFAQKAVSGYGVLLDFPPPLFVLRLKGAYGLLNEYQLHKVKDNYRIDASTGNYEITVDFVGHGFAILSDIPIGFIRAVHYLRTDLGEINIDQAKAPRSFFELITKGDILYNKIETYKNNSKDYKKISNIDNIRSEIENVKALIDGVGSSNQGFKNFTKDGLNSDKVIVTNDSINEHIDFEIPKSGMLSGDTNTLISNIELYLKEVQNNIINDYPSLKLSKSTTIKTINNPKSVFATIYFHYSGLNKELKDKYDKANADEKASLIKIQQDLNTDINNILGFTPTVKNVLKLLADDVDYFFKLLIESAQYDETEKTKRITNEDVVSIQPYPTVVGSKNQNGTIEKTYIYPGEVKEFQNWGEVKFVENLVVAILRQSVLLDALDKEQSNEGGDGKWIPVTPLETNDNGVNILKNDYFPINYDRTKILEKIFSRYIVFKDYTFNFTSTEFRTETNSKNVFIDFYAKNEAKNLIYSLLKQNNNVVLSIKNVVDNKNGNPIEYLITKFEGNKSQLIKRIATDSGTLNDSTFQFNGLTLNSKANNDFESIRILDADDLNEQDFSTSDNEIGKELENFESAIKESQGFFSKYYGRVKVSKTNKNVILLLDNNKSDSADLKLTDEYGDDFNSSYFNTGISNILYNSNNIFDKIYESIKEVIKTKNEITNEDIFSYFKDNNFIRTYKDGKVKTIFQTPSIVEVPNVFILYIGWLLEKDEPFNSDNSVSEKDKKIITDYYKEENKLFLSPSEFDEIKRLFILTAEDSFTEGVSRKKIEDLIKNKLNNNSFFLKKYISISSSNSFIPNTNDGGFVKTLFKKIDKNNSETIRFFETFISECSRLLKDRKLKENEVDIVKKGIADNDIKYSIYSDLKTIYDRWFAIPDGEAKITAPTPFFDKFKIVDRTMFDISDTLVNFESLIEDSKTVNISLFTILGNFLSQNNFLFYPIQTSMIFNNQQNASKKWNDSLGINIRNIILNKSEVAFICLYMGKASSNLNIETLRKGENENSKITKESYPDDSISFKPGRTPSDFLKSSEIKGNNVYVMSVKIGKSNQSYFGNIELDSAEYKNTSESLKLLDDLIKKQANSNPVAKGQNLFELYSQRVYNCKIDIPLGNTCIQPCMYFELEGLPMWNGGYLISEVEHSFSLNNKLRTSFKGTRVGKYALPKVTSPTVNYLPNLDLDESRFTNANVPFTKISNPPSPTPTRDITNLTVPIAQTELKII